MTRHPERVRPRDDRRLAALIGWYALYQAAHVVVNARAVVAMLDGRAVFPGYPPTGGWSEQVLVFFVGMAAVDLVNAVLALAFAYGYVRDVTWWPRLGTVTLSVSVYASLVFGYATYATGAWDAHPLAYGLLYATFLPVYALFVVWLRGPVTTG